jgi:hypothetical protein
VFSFWRDKKASRFYVYYRTTHVAVLHLTYFKSYRRPLQSSAWVNHWSLVERIRECATSRRPPRKRSSAKTESIQSLVEIIVKTDPFVTIHKLKWILQDTHRIRVIVHCLQMFEDIENVLQSGCALSTASGRRPQHPFLASTTPVYDDGISIDEACCVL